MQTDRMRRLAWLEPTIEPAAHDRVAADGASFLGSRYRLGSTLTDSTQALILNASVDTVESDRSAVAGTDAQGPPVYGSGARWLEGRA